MLRLRFRRPSHRGLCCASRSSAFPLVCKLKAQRARAVAFSGARSAGAQFSSVALATEAVISPRQLICRRSGERVEAGRRTALRLVPRPCSTARGPLLAALSPPPAPPNPAPAAAAPNPFASPSPLTIRRRTALLPTIVDAPPAAGGAGAHRLPSWLWLHQWRSPLGDTLMGARCFSCGATPGIRSAPSWVRGCERGGHRSVPADGRSQRRAARSGRRQ